MSSINLYPPLQKVVDTFGKREIPSNRKKILDDLADYVRQQLESDQAALLNFICTHNSRRSQLAQVWAQTAADYLGVEVKCYSGGVEVTAFNERAVASLQRSGFRVSKEGDGNPKYVISYAETGNSITTFSKLFDDPANPPKDFAAVMTCAEADENCPVIPGAAVRIPLRYEDPKAFDGTGQESEKYDERSLQIASEMFYLFEQLK